MSNSEEKLISLFKYIQELYKQKTTVVSDVKKQPWTLFVSDIPQNPNIELNFADKVDDEVSEEIGQLVILNIKNTEYQPIPQPPQSIIPFLQPGYDKFKNEVTVLESIEIENGQNLYETIVFSDDERRVADLKEWKLKRTDWVQKQREIHRVRTIFKNIYDLHLDLQRDSEELELVIGQGMLECDDVNVYHPILIKRLQTEFNADSNIVSIVDSNVNSEIYDSVLGELDFVNHSVIIDLKEELKQNLYHPLDRNDTPNYLKRFVRLMSSNGRYVENEDEQLMIYDKLVIRNKPVFFLRKKSSGVISAIDSIMKDIQENGVKSGPLVNIIGGNEVETPESLGDMTLELKLAQLSGEDPMVLMSKAANSEQLEIAKKIDKYTAVLVQGPPGTGKTHTIANLIGHLLSQGKNILITSHTTKALSVLKDKIEPKLQNLAVSVLGDNNKDMEKSVDGITDYISRKNSIELQKEIDEFSKKRSNLLIELNNIRKTIYKVKHQESATIVINGMDYSPSEAARFIFENKDNLTFIPGKIALYEPLPLTESEVKFLYKTNKSISLEDERELKLNLPNPNEILIPAQFEKIFVDVANAKEEIEELKKETKREILIQENKMFIDATLFCEGINQSMIDELNELLACQNVIKQPLKWHYKVMLAGKQGGNYKKIWINLNNKIKETCNFAEEAAQSLFAKQIIIEPKLINASTIAILEQIKIKFDGGKKITKLDLLFHKEWKIISDVQINNAPVATIEDCISVINYIKLFQMRQELNVVWTELISKNGGVSFSDLGECPEQVCINSIEIICQLLEWYNNDYTNILELAKLSGFSSDSLFGSIENLIPIEDIKYRYITIYKMLPVYIKIAILNYNDIALAREEIKKLYDFLNSASGSNALVCRDLIFSIKVSDTNGYEKAYDTLKEMYNKNYDLSERERLLEKLNDVASEWANAIKNRIGIHGDDVCPVDIKKAWLYKQFEIILDEMQSCSLENLQKSLRLKTLELRQVTTNLIASSSWYYLLLRIENDMEKRRALQGWKLTEKKIGKGTGKNAAKYRKEAQKLMTICQTAVPVWIMSINKALETLDPAKNKFDVIIVDEASQSDISALAIMYLAKKIIIVGDNEQVSPLAVGMNVDKMNKLIDMYIKDQIPNYHLYDLKTSIYDIALTTFTPVMLKEHFRCLPEIINYSNKLSYDWKIKPLRDGANCKISPPTICFRVDGERMRPKKINQIEADNISALILSCISMPEYKQVTFGVISMLGDEQAILIDAKLREVLTPKEYDHHKILCGNASHFQGDERDVIFLSLVDNNEDEGPLRKTGEGTDDANKKRYNVAVSRAKDQLWVVHSLDVANDLKSDDLRRDLIEYAMNPNAIRNEIYSVTSLSESPFEKDVAKQLILKNYKVTPQWKVGSYRIDMVVTSANGKNIAVECDGEAYHSGDEKIRQDMERQTILERLDWKFIRIRGSEFYRNPNECMNRVFRELEENEIYPHKQKAEDTQKSDLLDRVKIKAHEILKDWEISEKNDEE